MSKSLAYHVNYEKAINKAINNSEMQVKEKHMRSVIMGTFLEKGAEMFWHVTLGFSNINSKPIAWKLCYVLHKILREGHSLCCVQSQGHKKELDKIGNAWSHSNEDFGKIIQIYTKLLITKLEFHFQYPEFPGHLDATLAELQLTDKNDMSNYFQLSVDILEYLDYLLQFQEAVLESLMHPITARKAWECKLAPLALCIQESSQLYTHCVRILFILHSSLPTDSLSGHRIRFEKQFKRLKMLYSNATNIQCLNILITVPSLPEKSPNFFIEANLPSHIHLEGFESSRKTSFDYHVHDTSITSPRNIVTEQFMVPDSNEFVEEDLIDLSGSPPFYQFNYLKWTADLRVSPGFKQKPTAPPCCLPVSTYNSATPTKNSEFTPKYYDPFDISFLEHCKQPEVISPVIHQMYIENMIGQKSKNSPSSELKSTERNTLNPFHGAFSDPYNDRHLNVPSLTLPMQMMNERRSNSTEENVFDRFDMPFFRHDNDHRPSAPPLSSVNHQIHAEALIERDNYIQYLMHELELLRHENYRKESDNFRKFQEKVMSMEKSLFAQESEAARVNQTKMSINHVPSTPQYNNSKPALKNQNPDQIGESWWEIVNFKLQDKATTNSDFEWDKKNEINEVQNGIKNLELENKIRDVEHNPAYRHQNDRGESDNLKKFQEKVRSMEKSLLAKENKASRENQTQMLINGFPSTPTYNFKPAFENHNSKNFIDEIGENVNIKLQVKPTTNSDFDWDKKNEIDEVQNGINNLELEDKIRDVEHNPACRHQNDRGESDNLKKFQEKVRSMEKSLFAKENKASRENQTQVLINRIPSTPTYNSKPALENHNSKNFIDEIGENVNIKLQVKPTTNSDFDWDKKNEIDEVQNGIKNLELENKIRDFEHNPAYRHQNDRVESDNLKKFQEKVRSMEKSLFAKENKVSRENQTQVLINHIPSIPTYNSKPAFENHNSKNFIDEIGENVNIKLQVKPTTNSDFDWDKKNEIDEVQNGIKNLELENKIRDVEHNPACRHQNYRIESDNLKKFQEKVRSMEKSLFAKENIVSRENQTQVLINRIPSTSTYNSKPALENQNSKNFIDEIGENVNLKLQVEPTTDSDSDWDKEDDIDEEENEIKNLELENKIRDIEQQIDLHMQNRDLEVWNNNRELFNIKTEILKMSLENFMKEKQVDAAEPENKVKKDNLVNRKFKKVTSFLKTKKIKLKG